MAVVLQAYLRRAYVYSLRGWPSWLISKTVFVPQLFTGLGNNAADYSGLVSLLNERDLSVHVLPVARIDWGRNASGLIYKGAVRTFS